MAVRVQISSRADEVLAHIELGFFFIGESYRCMSINKIYFFFKNLTN
jgi:hypothetical protein